tara:strand:- start:210 stop:683 length:474 start_codon:yes stop_codon:yes gene_type:complete
MIIHDINSTNPYLWVSFIIFFNVVTLIAIIFFIVFYRDKIKWREWKYPIVFTSFWFIFLVPFSSIASIAHQLNILSKYESGIFEEFNGYVKKITGNTTGVTLSLGKNKSYFFYSREGCFSSFRAGSGFDINKKLYMKFIPYNETSETAYCIVYIEQK